MFERVIRRTHERPCFDVFETHGFAEDFEFGELVGVNVADDGEMVAGGLEVLAQREDVRALRGEILEGVENFLLFFAEAEHEAGLGGDIGMRLLGAAEEFERTLVQRALADLAVKARNGFGVVIENVRPGGKDGVEGVPISSKIGNEHFDFAAGDAAANFFDGTGKDVRAAVGLIVAIDAGDDSVTQTHSSHGFRDTEGFLFIGRPGGFA